MDARSPEKTTGSESSRAVGVSLLVVSVFGLAASGHAYAAGSPVVAAWVFVAVLVLLVPGYVMAFRQGDKLRQDLYGSGRLANGPAEEGEGTYLEPRERQRDRLATDLPRSLGPHGVPGLPVGRQRFERPR